MQRKTKYVLERHGKEKKTTLEFKHKKAQGNVNQDEKRLTNITFKNGRAKITLGPMPNTIIRNKITPKL